MQRFWKLLAVLNAIWLWFKTLLLPSTSRREPALRLFKSICAFIIRWNYNRLIYAPFFTFLSTSDVFRQLTTILSQSPCCFWGNCYAAELQENNSKSSVSQKPVLTRSITSLRLELSMIANNKHETSNMCFNIYCRANCSVLHLPGWPFSLNYSFF